MVLLNCPINNLSYGQISVGLIKGFHESNIDLALSPIGEIDLSAYDVDNSFKAYIQSALNNKWRAISEGWPCLKVWHINGSESTLPNQSLLTFHETDRLTETEVKILSLQKRVIVASIYTQDIFAKFGIQSEFIPMGVDFNLFPPSKPSIDGVQWSLIGKFEKRKNTRNIINAWVDVYGGDRENVLNLLVYNKFLSKAENESLLIEACGGSIPDNVNPISPIVKNGDVLSLQRACEYDLSGLSFGEGLNLPALTAYHMNKKCFVFYAHSHKTWVDEVSCYKVPIEGKQEVYDGKFFNMSNHFNQGFFPNYSQETLKNRIYSIDRSWKENIIKYDFNYKTAAKTINEKIKE